MATMTAALREAAPRQAANDNLAEGEALLRFTLGADGRAYMVEVLEEHPRGHRLGERAAIAFERVLFQPVISNGVPVEQPGRTCTVRFVNG